MPDIYEIFTEYFVSTDRKYYAGIQTSAKAGSVCLRILERIGNEKTYRIVDYGWIRSQ